MTIEQRVERIEYIYLRMRSCRNAEQHEAYRERMARNKARLLAQIAAEEVKHA